MAVHMVAVAAALHLSRGGAAAGRTTQVVASLAWPYLLRLCLSLRIAHQDLVSATRLFLFQLTQILPLDHHHHHHDDQIPVDQTASNSRSRWGRALRLVRGRLDEARRRVVVTFPHSDEEAANDLHLLSMISL